MNSGIRATASTLLLLYIYLLSVAAWCQTPHLLAHELNHHQSHTESTHSSLCTWACKVSLASSTAQISSMSLHSQLPQLACAFIPTLFIQFHSAIDFLPTRAPPIFLSAYRT